MRYVNDYDLQTAERWTQGNAALRSAVQTVSDLMDWTNSNSDGWPYWLPPRRAAQKLIELVWGDGTNEGRERTVREVTEADVATALRPIKAFRTRVTKADHGYGSRKPMPWWPITQTERDNVARLHREAERLAHETSVYRLADKLEPLALESLMQAVAYRDPDEATLRQDARQAAVRFARAALTG